MENRRERIIGLVKQVCRDRIPKARNEVLQYYISNESRILMEVKDSFVAVMEKAGEKEIYNMVISFLYSSYFTNSRKYKITLYNHMFYLDYEPIYGEVCFNFMNQFFDADVLAVMKEVAKEHVRMSETEKIMIRTECGRQYLGLLSVCLQNLMLQIKKLDSFRRMNRSENFRVILNEYMGPGQVLFEAGKEEEDGIFSVVE